MARRIVWFLCITMGVGCLSQKGALAGEETEKTVKLESGIYYTVERGDTLWGICERFYDFPGVWPDLWKWNPQIANPNWIYPGQKIRLFGREELETIVKPEEPIEPETVVQPSEPPYYFYAAIDRVGFIKEKAVPPSGSILKARESQMMISEEDFVYVRPSGQATFKAGDRYAVFRTKPVRRQEDKAFIGFQHLIVGAVEITDVEPDFSLGRIIQSFQDIEVNDLLMPYEARSPKITLAQSTEGLKGRIIVSERHEMMFGWQAVVFIDRGRKHGVKAGQSYSVYYQEREYPDPQQKESILLSPVDFGTILILHTEETTATALVTMADKDMQAGEEIRASPKLRAESSTQES